MYKKIDIYAVVRVYGKPMHTFATLKSLALTTTSENLCVHYLIVFTHSEDLPVGRFIELLEDSDLKNYNVKYVPLSSPTENLPDAVRYYYDYAKTQVHEVYFCYIENDNLFNSNWIEHLMYIVGKARDDGLKVGICTPHHITGKVNSRHKDPYETKDPGEDKEYYTKVRVPGCVLLFTPAAICSISVDDVCFHINHQIDWRICDKLCAFGFKHISPKRSVAQHIGRTGIGSKESWWKYKGRGGINFTPDIEVEGLWKEFNKDLVSV